MSRNTYRQFDINAQGAIFNNSRTAVQSQLGGFLAANPWLATGSARVILNEVNSSSPSHLRGPLEVAGSRAEVVVANPSGIQVDGATFINANRVTLTTGVPQLNAFGGIENYRVTGGNIGVSGAGLNVGGTEFARATRSWSAARGERLLQRTRNHTPRTLRFASWSRYTCGGSSLDGQFFGQI